MPPSIPKVQQKAIEQITSESLNSTDYRYLMHEAAEKGWAHVVQVAIERGEDRTKLLQTMLHEASKFGRDHAETVRVILAAGADPNGKNVLEYCGVDSLAVLVDAGGDVDVRGGSPLLKAITERTKQDKALALIAADANVNVADGDGVTAVMHAAAMGRNKVYDALVKAGADLYAVDKTGRSLARQIAESLAGGSFYSSESDRKKATRIARELRKMLPAQPEDQILLAIVTGDTKELGRLLDGGLDANTMLAGGLGLTGFTFEDAIEKLKQSGDIMAAFQTEDFIPTKQQRDEEMGGMTLLMWATATQQTDCIRVLLDHGADPQLKNDGGLDALTIAEKRVKYHAITQLLRGGITTPAGEKPTTPSRCETLGLLPSEVEKELVRLQQFVDETADVGGASRTSSLSDTPAARLKAIDQVSVGQPRRRRKRETPPENRGHMVEQRWELAQLHYVLAEADACQKQLQQALTLAEELFFGVHFQQPYGDSRAPLPHTAQWKAATKHWGESFPMALAACGVLNQWDTADRLLTFSDENCTRGDKSPKYNPEYYEWPLWMHLGAIARNEPPPGKWLASMQKESTRQSKAMLAAYQAIADAKPKPAEKAIDRIVQAHIAYQKKWSKGVFASRCVSPAATYFFHRARQQGLAIAFAETWDPYVMQLPSEAT